MNIEVSKADVLCVRGKDGEFVLMNLKTKEVWPISKEGMYTLAGNLDRWFQEIVREQDKSDGESSKGGM